MHFACEHNMPGVALQLAKLLRSHGASISSLDEELHTPLFNACAAGNLQLAQWLHSEGAEMEQATSHDEGCGTPFLVAVMNGDESVARWLAQVGAEVKAHDSAMLAIDDHALSMPERMQKARREHSLARLGVTSRASKQTRTRGQPKHNSSTEPSQTEHRQT